MLHSIFSFIYYPLLPFSSTHHLQWLLKSEKSNSFYIFLDEVIRIMKAKKTQKEMVGFSVSRVLLFELVYFTTVIFRTNQSLCHQCYERIMKSQL